MIYRIIVVLGLFFIQPCVHAQSPLTLFEVVSDAEEKKFLKGFITKDQITNDPDFAWYQQNLKYAKANAQYAAIIKEKAYDFQVILFLGTWCHDSQQILPKYFSLLEASEFPDHHMTLIACDRQKTTLANLQRPFKVANVPTLIVMKDGKEVGRIVEFGESGMVDKDLADLVKKL
jgi:thiol-disulfide isomerase/thioredoxin